MSTKITEPMHVYVLEARVPVDDQRNGEVQRLLKSVQAILDEMGLPALSDDEWGEEVKS